MKKADSSLPQRAGRAYAKLRKGDWQPTVYAVNSKGRGISVSAVMRPKPDLQKLVRAAVAIQRAKRDETSPDPSDP